MALKQDIGPYVYARGKAVSQLSYEPPGDREFYAAAIYINDPSASDTWYVNVGGRDIMRVLVNVTGNQQLFGGITGNFPRMRNLFEWFKQVYGEELMVPVPQNMAITVGSVGGATGNVVIEGRDLTLGSTSQAMMNHYQGTRLVIPVQAYVNAAVAAAGEIPVDTEVKPAWLPNIFLGQSMRPGFRIRVLAAWLEAMSVNTYSGAANHVSSIDHVRFDLNGDRQFSHVLPGQVSGPLSTVSTVPAGNIVTPDGIPVTSQPAAAGSANTVYTLENEVFPPFQAYTAPESNMIDPPVVINQGDVAQLFLGIAGDVTGGAGYAGGLMTFLCEILRSAV